MKKTLSVMLLMAVAASGQQFLPQSHSARPSAATILTETGGGLLGTALGTGVALGVAWGVYTLAGEPSPYQAENFLRGAGAGIVGGLVGLFTIPLGASHGVSLVGGAFGHHGNRTGATIGAYVGLPVGALVGVGLVGLTGSGGGGLHSYLAGTSAGLVVISVGSVVGYNMGEPGYADIGPHDSRLLPPALALRTEELTTGECATALDIRAVTVRF